MKKNLLLLTFVVIEIITAIAVTQLNNTGCDEILNANIEVLAWNDSGGGDGQVDCKEGKKGCTFKIIMHDEEGNVVKDPEGNTLYIEGVIPYMSNMKPQAQ